MDKQTLDYYAANAPAVSKRYNSVGSPIADLLARFVHTGHRVLDIGSGSGRDLNEFSTRGFQAFGVEPVEELRREALINYPHLKGRIIEGGLPGLGEPFGGEFDAITCSAVLMHVDTWDLFDSFLAIKKALKNEGYLILSVSTERPSSKNSERDESGRLFKTYSPDYFKLLLGRLGFTEILRESNDDTLGRGDIRWASIVYRLRSATNSRPIEQLEGVLNNDKKDATYKLALVRALAEIATQNHGAIRWRGDGFVEVPIDLVVDKWIDYYWPLLESEEFIPQRQSEEPGRTGQIAFRSVLSSLIERYRASGGHIRFRKEASSGVLDNGTERLYRETKKKIRETIVNQPIKYAGGSLSSGPVFGYENKSKAVHLSNDLWIEISLLGHWISESVILRWAEECTRMGVKRGIQLHKVIELLVQTDDPRRVTTYARELFNDLAHIECVWTGKSVVNKFDVDHVIPYSLWKNNDLWNLLPTDPTVNNAKRDRLPTHALLHKRRDCIIFYWEYLNQNNSSRFLNEAKTLCSNLGNNWQINLFSKLREAVELTAINRSISRWQP